MLYVVDFAEKRIVGHCFNDKIELPHHIKKPTTFKKVTKLWDSMK